MIRLYQPKDRDAVRNIACETGFYGKPIDRLFKDRDLMADFLIRGYEVIEPDHFWVAEEDGIAQGYLCGTLDMKTFGRKYATRVLPGLAWKFLARGHWLDGTLWKVFSAESRTGRKYGARRKAIVDQYPANFHINLLEGFQGRGLGRQLIDKFMDQCRAAGVPGVHIATGTDDGKKFFGKRGFETLFAFPAPELPLPGPSEIRVMGTRL